MVNVTADDVEEIDLAGGDHAPANLQALFAGEALFPVFIRHHSQADNIVRPDPIANGVEHAMGEAQPGCPANRHVRHRDC